MLIRESTKEELMKMNKPCYCGLKPMHVMGMHDYKCFHCGKMHHQSICPEKKK